MQKGFEMCREPDDKSRQVERLVRLNWKSYPDEKPLYCGKCLVELHSQGDLGLNKYLWFANWNYIEKKWEDFFGCNDIESGTVVKRFIEDKYLW